MFAQAVYSITLAEYVELHAGHTSLKVGIREFVEVLQMNNEWN